MLAPWLLYSTWIGATFCLVGLLGDRILRWRGDATRWYWLAAIVLMPVPPILLNLLPAGPSVSPAAAVLSMVNISPLSAPPVALAPPRHDYDTPLLALWLLASSVVLLRVIGAAVAVHRRRRQWIPAQLNGQSVLLSEELGPAVIGWRRFTTVVPRWALTFDERSRELMLAHEAEHASSGDPYLRSIALLALILMPWNLALWFAARRLRLAIEMDCDRRVLARGADPQQYAALLLAVGERMSATPFAWATALGGTRSLLETRVRGMVAPWVPRYPRLAIGSLKVAATVIAIAACSAPVPEAVRIAARQSGDSLASGCKAGTGCPDTAVWKLVNWVVTVRNPKAAHFRLPGTSQRGCLPSASVCGSIVDENGNETLFGSDTLFVDSKSGRIWTSARLPDDLEATGVESGGRGMQVNRAASSNSDDLEIVIDPVTHQEAGYRSISGHFCATIDLCDSRLPAMKALSGANTPRPPAVGHDIVPSICPPKAATGGYWPRCVD